MMVANVLALAGYDYYVVNGIRRRMEGGSDGSQDAVEDTGDDDFKQTTETLPTETELNASITSRSPPQNRNKDRETMPPPEQAPPLHKWSRTDDAKPQEGVTASAHDTAPPQSGIDDENAAVILEANNVNQGPRRTVEAMAEHAASL
mmetsp:Transcript_17505/g.38174  ORF Transcript_17505/g.38174 Transcript_17505/m.38174 type:complete len:147 (+) Transcript_17505:2250-2690(+)